MHPYVNETWHGVNNLEPGSTSSNSVPSSPWTYAASQDRLLENLQHFNSMYPRSAVPDHVIENQQHLNSAYSEGAAWPSDQEFYRIDNVLQVNQAVYPERAVLVPGEFNYLFANQQFSSAPAGEQNFYNFDSSEQVDSIINPEVPVTGEWFSMLYPEELPVNYCNNQIALELAAELNHHSYMWSTSQAGGGEPGASSSASVPSSTVSAFSCQTVCSTPEPEALLSPIATDPSTEEKSWLQLPAEHRFTSSEVATSDYHEGVTKKKKARKPQCEVRISKKLRKSEDMIRSKKLWITFDRAEQADRAKQVVQFLLSSSKSKYEDTQFDPPEIEPELRALRADMQENGVDSNMFCKVKKLATWYGKHGAT